MNWITPPLPDHTQESENHLTWKEHPSSVTSIPIFLSSTVEVEAHSGSSAMLMDKLFYLFMDPGPKFFYGDNIIHEREIFTG